LLSTVIGLTEVFTSRLAEGEEEMKTQVRTGSWLRGWYLMTFRRYRLAYKAQRPIRLFYLLAGVILYETTWVLTTA
jgi:hypothetical protein